MQAWQLIVVDTETESGVILLQCLDLLFVTLLHTPPLGKRHGRGTVLVGETELFLFTSNNPFLNMPQWYKSLLVWYKDRKPYAFWDTTVICII